MILNYALNIVLKRAVGELRPEPSHRVPNVHYNKYGMPSTHAQFQAFYAAYLTLFLLFRLPHSKSTMETFLKVKQKFHVAFTEHDTKNGSSTILEHKI